MQLTHPCAVEECDKPKQKRGWCGTHYMRWRRTGAPDGSSLLPAFDRFMSHVDTSGGPDACHPWTASKNEFGYGFFRVNRRTHIAPRWLLGHLRGSLLELPEIACHHCDNPACCNPTHLYVGTQKTNAEDCVRRGRKRVVVADQNREKTHCKRDHPFDETNTYITSDGRRQCRRCMAIRQQNRKQRSAKAPLEH